MRKRSVFLQSINTLFIHVAPKRPVSSIKVRKCTKKQNNNNNNNNNNDNYIVTKTIQLNIYSILITREVMPLIYSVFKMYLFHAQQVGTHYLNYTTHKVILILLTIRY